MPRVLIHLSDGAGKALNAFQSTTGRFSAICGVFIRSNPLDTRNVCTAIIESLSPVSSDTSEESVPLAPQE